MDDPETQALFKEFKKKQLESQKNADKKRVAFISELDEICELINRNEKMLEILKTSNVMSKLTENKNTEELK
ncbi:MAG: hypothetical protein BGO07_02895 [Alphaproteobacteria bacterium 40-19]|nr:MAG: hypothetical protein BGO07_02895 [Alphaproteobacteria bacterium 40-19]